MSFSIDRFERLAWRRDHESACRELLLLLTALDRGHGLTAADQPPLDTQRCTRIAAAMACLLSDASLQFSPQWVAPILAMHRWLAALFNASAWGNGDAVIQALNSAADGSAAAPTKLAIAPRDIVKFCLLYGAESALPLDLGALWQHDRKLAVSLGVALLAPRLLCTPAAHGKREQLLPWLADHLGQIDDIADLPADVLHDVYMQCSYADRPDKHDVKRAISGLVQRSLQRRGIVALPAASGSPGTAANTGRKPVLLVLVEWFSAGHSMVRTHSRTLEAARACFEVVGMGYGFAVDDTGRRVFDRFVGIPRDADLFTQLRQVQQEAQQCGAAVLYMPSLGMSALTMFAANLRMAPLQVMGLGHPATAHAAAVDLAVVEADYVGDPACFSERLLLLPPDGMPYRPVADRPVAKASAAGGLAVCAAENADAETATTQPRLGAPTSPGCAPAVQAVTAHGGGFACVAADELSPSRLPAADKPTRHRPRAPQTVEIALCATLMKLNPALLAACAAIVQRAPLPVHFRLLIGQAQGLIVPQLERAVRAVLGQHATVHPQQPYAAYRAVIDGCDLFINPFPFGNTNGTIDCVEAGLVGVCKTGPEVHAHIDEGMFRRMGWPAWLVAPTVSAYVDAAVRLAASHDERADLRAAHAGPDKAALFYAGRPQLMGEMLLQAWSETASQSQSPYQSQSQPRLQQ